jgi:F0F1-type ATP synthase assembly protein I
MIEMKKYQWSVALAIVGGLLSTKTASIEITSVAEGCFVGAVVGFVLGWLLDRRYRSRPHD